MGSLVFLLWIALSGVVTSPQGTPVPNATVAIRNLATGATIELRVDSTGRYSAPDLAPGEYELTASAAGFNAKTTKVAVSSAGQRLDLALSAPASKPDDLSLADLGF